MATEITQAHRALLSGVQLANIPRLKALCDEYLSILRTINENGPSDASMGAWSDAQYATQRAALRVALHACGANMVTEATAAHDAAAGVVTDWT